MLAVNMEDVARHAKENDCPSYISAVRLNSPLASRDHFWPMPESAGITEAIKATDIDLSIGSDNLLKSFCKSISETVKFPFNTAYLHGLGVVAAAMNKSFTFQYDNKFKPVNLYVVTSQPPSTGKSGVNEILTDPIMEAYETINNKNRIVRRKLEREIAQAEKDLNGVKADDPHGDVEPFDRLERAEHALKNTPDWVPFIDDATIEAAEDLCSRQTGMWNILSAEAESINVIVGSVYGDESKIKNSNYGLILKSWDGERTASARITRAGYKGPVRGSIAVIAQQESIETILAIGASSGRGLAERFLLLSEDSLLGKRDHNKKVSLRIDLLDRYKSLITNIINEKIVKLKIPDSAMQYIRSFRDGIEPNLADGGIYAHNLLTGFMGKADKQVIKIACVLHVVKNWEDGGSMSVDVDEGCIIQAICLFEQLGKTYINAADCMGYVGGKSEIIKASEYLESKAQRGINKIRVSQMVNDLKGVKPFKGTRKITEKIRQKTLPILENLKYCVVSENSIYINPRLK